MTLGIAKRAEQGLVRTREDVLEQIMALGLDVTRTGKSYITVTSPENDQRWRLKGPMFARDFNPGSTIEKADRARERNYSEPDQRTAGHYAYRVERHIAARTEYHQKRYSRTLERHRLESIQEQSLGSHYDRDISLSGAIRRELGDDGIPLRSVDQSDKARSHDAEERHKIGGAGRENSDLEMRGQQQAMRQGQSEIGEIREHRGRLSHFGGLLNDRTRDTLADRFEKFGKAVQRAAQNLTDDVRAYFSREQSITRAGHELEQSGRSLDRECQPVREALFQEQKLEKQHERSHGISL